MLKQEIRRKIDRAIKECWKINIRKDYWEEYLLREDALKCAMYYHLRRKLATVLKENSLRIYPEYYFADLRYRADLVIVQIDEKMEYSWLGEAVTDVIALLELKFTAGTDAATVSWIKNDIWKFKDYRKIAGLENCQFYLAAIYESKCSRLNWIDARSTNNWANGSVTELNAGLIGEEMVFGVHSYNNWNTDLNDLPDGFR